MFLKDEYDVELGDTVDGEGVTTFIIKSLYFKKMVIIMWCTDT